MHGLNSSTRTTPRRCRPSSLFVFLILLVAAWKHPSPACGQPAKSSDIPTFTDIVDVRVVNVEVVVTGGGKRVTDLSPSDFELLVDGKAMPIDFFTEVRDGHAAKAIANPLPGAATAPSAAAAMPSVVIGQAIGTNYLIFIDDFFSLPSHRDRVLGAILKQLDSLVASDRMAIVAFDGQSIDLLSGWTNSSSNMTRALNQAMGRKAYGLRRMSEIRRLGALTTDGANPSYSSSFSSIGFRGSGRSHRGVDSSNSQDITFRVSRVVSAAASTLRGFARPPEGQSAGRKVMLLLSGGWPVLTTKWNEVLSGAGRAAGPSAISLRERLEVFEPLIGTANRLGFTLYPVNLQPAGILYGGAQYSRSPSLESGLLEADSGDALFALAEATGGRSFEHSAISRLALKKTAEDTRSYYWLGFSPDWRGDGTEHRVKVRVKRRGLRVRSRTSFADLSPRTDIELMLEGAQLFDRPLPGDDELEAELGKSQRVGRGRIVVPLRLTIPLDAITLLPGKNGLATSLELRVAARDDDGQVARIPLSHVHIKRQSAAKIGDVEVHEVQLKLRSKSHRLTVALYEPSTGNILSRRLKLEI